jgi:APA family basic amino acid/polyamine antiporter
LLEYIKGFGIGLVAVSFTCGGYQQTINLGADVEKPNKTIPKGIFFGIFVIVSLYLLINYAYVKVIGFETLKTSKNIAAIMASKVFGVNAERILSVLLFLGVLAYINGQLLSNPRVMYAMSEDKLLPGFLQNKNSKGALTWSVTFFAALAALIVFWAKEFDSILSFSIFLDSFGMALSAGSIFILRKRTVHLNNSGIYQMKLYPVLPIIFITSYLFVAASIAADSYKTALTGIAVFSAFLIIYFTVYKKQLKQQG